MVDHLEIQIEMALERQKPCKYLGKCQKIKFGHCSYQHKPCKYKAECKQLQSLQCQYYHPNDDFHKTVPQLKFKNTNQNNLQLITVIYCNYIGYTQKLHKEPNLWQSKWGNSSERTTTQMLINSKDRFNANAQTHIAQPYEESNWCPHAGGYKYQKHSCTLFFTEKCKWARIYCGNESDDEPFDAVIEEKELQQCNLCYQLKECYEQYKDSAITCEEYEKILLKFIK